MRGVTFDQVTEWRKQLAAVPGMHLVTVRGKAGYYVGPFGLLYNWLAGIHGRCPK